MDKALEALELIEDSINRLAGEGHLQDDFDTIRAALAPAESGEGADAVHQVRLPNAPAGAWYDASSEAYMLTSPQHRRTLCQDPTAAMVGSMVEPQTSISVGYVVDNNQPDNHTIIKVRDGVTLNIGQPVFRVQPGNCFHHNYDPDNTEHLQSQIATLTQQLAEARERESLAKIEGMSLAILAFSGVMASHKNDNSVCSAISGGIEIIQEEIEKLRLESGTQGEE